MSLFHKALIISIIAHIAVLLYAPSIDEIKKKKPKTKKQIKKITIKFRGNKKKQTIITQDKNGTKDCKKYYIGIGVMVDFLGQITSVAKGSPADRSGLKVNDFILTTIETQKLKEGDVIDVSVSRGGIIISNRITVERICKDDENNQSRD